MMKIAESWSLISSAVTVVGAMKDYETTCSDEYKIIGDMPIWVYENGVQKTARARGGDLICRSPYLILGQSRSF